MEARRVFDDAQRMLNEMIDNGSLKGKGLVGFWPAQSEGDDINVYKADVAAPRETEPIAKFRGLRQQVRVTPCCMYSAYSIMFMPSIGSQK